jgi:TfoX/Sxy family transcriptional regulator of competence genes
MHSDPGLVARVRDQLAQTRGVSEKTMFGGIAFFLDGNIVVAVWHDELIARIGPDATAPALAEPHVRPFDITGRPMTGWVMVAPDGIDTEGQLGEWLDLACLFVATLPAKAVKPAKPKSPRKRRLDD